MLLRVSCACRALSGLGTTPAPVASLAGVVYVSVHRQDAVSAARLDLGTASAETNVYIVHMIMHASCITDMTPPCLGKVFVIAWVLLVQHNDSCGLLCYAHTACPSPAPNIPTAFEFMRFHSWEMSTGFRHGHACKTVLPFVVLRVLCQLPECNTYISRHVSQTVAQKGIRHSRLHCTFHPHTCFVVVHTQQQVGADSHADRAFTASCLQQCSTQDVLATMHQSHQTNGLY